MKILKSKVMLDESYKNILVSESVQEYSKEENLSKTERVVAVMNDVFQMKDMAEEYIYLIALTSKCKPISFFEVCHGACNYSIVGTREIMIRALLCGAVNIILVHNHPSGNPTPSSDDLNFTERIHNASKLIGINLLDHIIIGRDGHISLNEWNSGIQDAGGRTE